MIRIGLLFYRMNKQIPVFYYIIFFLFINLLKGVDLTKASAKILGSDDELFQVFKNPTSEAKPFTRWWWGGNVLNAQEIVRQLEAFKEAGLGGVEINPAGRGFKPLPPGHKTYIWLSPEWCDMVKFTAIQARKRGLSTDLIGGTGWPFGGQFLKPDDQIQTIYSHYYPVKGGQTFTKTFSELVKDAHHGLSFHKRLVKTGYFKIPNRPDKMTKLSFATLVPSDPEKLSELIDLTTAFDENGSLSIKIPQGNYVLAVGIWSQGEQVRRVSVSTPGGGGPSLDHFAIRAPKVYFQRMSKALKASFGAPMGEHLRAMFVDSMELHRANWTGDFKEQFKKRAGYDITPWMPLVMSESGGAKNFTKGVNLKSELEEKVRRVCYDRNRIICELYHERFVAPFHNWCYDNDVLSRYQSYGSPWLMDLGNTPMLVDIPESNDWLNGRGFIGGDNGAWHKYSSSAANLRGLSIVSSEAMTNTKRAYRMSLSDFKSQMDMNFVLGINHAIWHGTSYCPKSLPFPGKAMFGSFFSERNTWWPWFKNFNDYTARLSSVFQNTDPVVQFAVLGPTADVWSDYGLHRRPFHSSPRYLQDLVQKIGQNGGSADYITEKTLQRSKTIGGKLCFGPMSYPVVIVAEAQTVEAKTAESLLKFVQGGGKLILLGEALLHSSGYAKARENDLRVREAKEKIIQSPHYTQLSPPGKDTLSWVEKTLFPAVKVKMPLTFSKTNLYLQQFHKTDGAREIFFFSNQSSDNVVKSQVKFKTSNKVAWVWDPETGERSPYPFAGNNIDLKLGPQESLLIVREPSEVTDLEAHYAPLCLAKEETKQLKGNWDCSFSIIESDTFDRKMKLKDLSKSKDSALSSFGGTVSYRKNFTGDGLKDSILDLGKVHGLSEVWINGKKLGTRWYGQHRYDLKDKILSGKNSIEIQVTTVALNYIKSLRPNGKVDRQKLVSTGLVGPVRFLKGVL